MQLKATAHATHRPTPTTHPDALQKHEQALPYFKRIASHYQVMGNLEEVRGGCAPLLSTCPISFAPALP